MPDDAQCEMLDKSKEGVCRYRQTDREMVRKQVEGKSCENATLPDQKQKLAKLLHASRWYPSSVNTAILTL